MNTNWRTTVGGILSAGGKGMFGIPVLMATFSPVFSPTFTVDHGALLCYVALVGLIMSVWGSAMVGVSAQDAAVPPAVTPPTFTATSRVYPPIVLLLCLLPFIAGCEFGKRDPRIVATLAGSVKRYETRIENGRAREEADEDAIRLHHTKEIQIAAKASVDIIASDPVTYPPAKAIQEVHRVDQVAAEKIASQESKLQKMRDLRAKDDAVNLAGARALMAKVMQFDQAPALDLTGTAGVLLGPGEK